MERPVDLSVFDDGDDEAERCGVVFEDDNKRFYVVEVPNRAGNTHDDFVIWESDVPDLPHPVVGVVHTHPSYDSPFPSHNDFVHIPPSIVGIVYQPATKSVVWYTNGGNVNGLVKIKDNSWTTD